MAVVPSWQLFPRGSCLLVAVVPSWQLSPRGSFSRGSCPHRGSCSAWQLSIRGSCRSWQLSRVAVVYEPKF